MERTLSVAENSIISQSYLGDVYGRDIGCIQWIAVLFIKYVHTNIKTVGQWYREEERVCFSFGLTQADTQRRYKDTKLSIENLATRTCMTFAVLPQTKFSGVLSLTILLLAGICVVHWIDKNFPSFIVFRERLSSVIHSCDKV